MLRVGEYDEMRRFTDVEAFLAKVVAADPSRAETAVRERDKVAALMSLHGIPSDDWGVLLP